MRINVFPFEMLFSSTNIPFCICTNEDIVFRFPSKDQSIFTKRFIKICLLDFFSRDKTSGPVIHFLNPGFYLGIVQLDQSTYLIIGPGIGRSYSIDEILPWMNSTLYEDNQDVFLRYLTSLSPITFANFQSTLRMAVYLYNGSELNFPDIKAEESLLLKAQVNTKLTNSLFEDREYMNFHTPEFLEAQLTEAIEQGNFAALESVAQHPAVGRPGVLSFDPEKQTRYMFVTVVSVCARAAMRGGLDYELACSMADVYCQRMDQLSDPVQILLLQNEMANDFCHAVHESAAYADYSPVIHSCINYIHMHTHDPICLNDLASYSHLSERRLSSRFQREVGCNIIDYIHKIKLEEAKMLLSSTNRSISQIAAFLSYSSQSYFTALFSKYYKVTPLQYRQSGHHPFEK